MRRSSGQVEREGFQHLQPDISRRQYLPVSRASKTLSILCSRSRRLPGPLSHPDKQWESTDAWPCFNPSSFSIFQSPGSVKPPPFLWLLPPLKVSLTSSSRCASRRRRRVCFFKLYFLLQNISNIQKRREILKFIPNTHHSASTIMDLGPHLFLWSRFLG